MRYAEKYGRARQVTDDNIIRCMRNEYWIAKATDVYSECVFFSVFHINSGYSNASQYYLIVRCFSCLNLMLYIFRAMNTLACFSLHSKTNQCTHVKCIYHNLFITDIFRHLSR